MYVCMYVCMYVWMDGWMDACMHACMYACMYVCTYVRMYVCTYVSMYVHMYICMYAFMHACMYVWMYVYKFWTRQKSGEQQLIPWISSHNSLTFLIYTGGFKIVVGGINCHKSSNPQKSLCGNVWKKTAEFRAPQNLVGGWTNPIEK